MPEKHNAISSFLFHLRTFAKIRYEGTIIKNEMYYTQNFAYKQSFLGVFNYFVKFVAKNENICPVSRKVCLAGNITA